MGKIEWGGTPGPWNISFNIIYAEGNDIVANVDGWDNITGMHGKYAANNRAIAKVPDMVQALRAVAASAMRNDAYDQCIAILASIDGEA